MPALDWVGLTDVTISGNSFALQNYFFAENITRVNNTVHVGRANTGFRAVRWAGSWISFNDSRATAVKHEMPRYTLRQDEQVLGSGNYINVNQEYWGNEKSYSFNVDMNATSVEVASGFWHGQDYWRTGWIAIPALGNPASIPAPSLKSRVDTSITINTGSGMNWGTNGNGTDGWWRIEHREVGVTAWTNGANQSGNVGNRDFTISGLKSNTSYEVRTRMRNGGGKEGEGAVATLTTLANATYGDPELSAAYFTVNVKPAQGRDATTSYIQYRKTGETSWLNSPKVAGSDVNVTVSGLLPNTAYDYRIAVETTAGTWFSPILALTTLPAAKVVHDDGTVKNAIPWAIYPNGDKKMLDVKLIKE